MLGPVPVLPQDIVHEVGVRACRCAVESIVRAHERAHLGIPGALLERREVILIEILQRNHGIEPVPDNALPSFQVVCRVVLAGGNHLSDRAVAFEALQECLDVAPDPYGVFPRSLPMLVRLCSTARTDLNTNLMASPPSWILVWVDVRCPEIQPGKPSVGKRAGLGADNVCHLVHQIVVKGRRQGD